MIESNIVKWVDLGDSMQSLDVYGKKKWVYFFNLIKVLISFKKFSIFFYIVLKCFYFLQIIMLNLTNLSDQNDSAIKILKYISTVIFVQEIITDSTTYKVAVIVTTVVTVISIGCFIYLVISVRINKFFIKIPITLFNLINILLLNYFVGPIVQISILATNCSNGVHKYLNVSCYSDSTHLIFLFISFFNFVFFVGWSIVLSIYYNEIGSINETKILARVNTNYEIYTNLSKISMFIFAYFIKFNGAENDTYKLILQIYMMINSIAFAIYVYKSVLFYDSRINATILYGWIFVSWFSIVILFKTILNINDTSIFHIIGWLIVSAIIYYLEELREEYLLTDFNIFEAKSMKEIELFNLRLFNLMNMRSIRNKTLLVGIIKKFEDIVKSNEEMKEKYLKLSTNEHLKKKFNSHSALSILSMIYIIYDHHLDKSILKSDILLTLCYFLMNKLKNVTFAVYLCSKIKAISHKQMYLKYLLMEEIKDYMINKLSKSNNKESIKHIQIGSVILYNIYIDLFKYKIYDSACLQIDYFDLLRNNVTSPNTTENFLKLGEDILNLRKEIMRLWEKILDLNCLNEEAFRDYTLYLREILQDDILLRSESKKFNTIRSAKFAERNNLYNSLFNTNSSIVLVDGYSSFGKVLYTTPNFPSLYNFSGKEVLNMTIDDLCPTVIKDFHKEIIDNAIRYSNLTMIFNTQRDLLLKGKTGNLHNVKVFIKSIPNLSYGLIYMVNVTKIIDNTYIIVLDKDFRISSFTDIFSQMHYSSNNGYCLDRNMINSYLGIILPDTLTQLEYTEEAGFFFQKDNFDFKGILYSVAPHRSLNEKVDKVLEQIKLNGRLNLDHEGYQDSTQEYEELVREINFKCTTKHSIFYRVTTKNFIDKYRYYRIYISNDLITVHENTNTNNTGNVSTGGLLGANNAKKKKADNTNNNSKGISGTNLGENEESQKLIKIKLNPFNSGEEGNKFLEQEIVEIKEPDLEAMQKKEKKQGEDPSISSRTKSALSKSSVDSASFNKLKNGILEKKEVSAIKYMKYLAYLFGVGTIILVFFASDSSNQKFSRLNNYLLENLYFNHSKITVSCIYLATLNLKFIKYQIYNNSRCYTQCTDFYSKALETCLTDLKQEKENSTDFYKDFKNILNKQKNIQLSLFNYTGKDSITIDVENNLNIIISYGLKLNSELIDYLNNPTTANDIISLNIIDQSLLYINDQSITGFDETQKQTNLEGSYFSPINIFLIIEAGLFSILIIFFVVFICKLSGLENFYLKRLVKFKNAPFEIYLKSLEEIKKRLRNDNGEDEEKLNNDLDMQDFGNQSKKSKEDESNKKNTHNDESAIGKRKKDRKRKKDGKEEGKTNKDKKKDDNKDDKRKNARKSKNKKVVKNYQEEKIEIMSKYFLKWNIFFCIKVVIIILLSASYYLVVSIIDQSTTDNMLTFDTTTNSIEGVYKESFMIYLNLKKELASFIENEIQKSLTASKFTSANQTVFYNGNPYSNALSLLNSNFYQMTLPSQIDTPKIGTLLMPLINTDLTTASSTIISLNNLYNSDACAILFDQTTQKKDYTECSKFWSSILLKGMEQSITQMSVVITSVLDDLHSLNQNTKSLDQILQAGSTFNTYEQFVELYLFKSYMETVQIFRSLNQNNLQLIYATYRSLMIGYICFVIILFGLLLYFVFKSKFIFNTFMNFIGILPVKFLMEDPNLYKEILRLERYIY